MSEHAQPQTEELKPHGDKLDSAVKPSKAPEAKQQQKPAQSDTDRKE